MAAARSNLEHCTILHSWDRLMLAASMKSSPAVLLGGEAVAGAGAGCIRSADRGGTPLKCDEFPLRAADS